MFVCRTELFITDRILLLAAVFVKTTFFATSEIEIPLLKRFVWKQTSIMTHFQSMVTDYSSAPECQGNFVLQLSIFCH